MLHSLLRQYLDPGADLPAVAVDCTFAEILCRYGLGALASDLARDGRIKAEDSASELLDGAAMTARLYAQRNREATRSIAATLATRRIDTVLLKGISAGEKWYAAPHTRLMGDVDLLVTRDDVESAASAIREIGYTMDSADETSDSTHHHIPPMRHPESGVIVELHYDLFSGKLASDVPFRPGSWQQHTEEAEIDGCRVLRLSPEMELAHTVVHWAHERKWPVSVFGMLDALLIAGRGRLEWRDYVAWMEANQPLAIATTVLLTFGQKHQLLDMPDPVVEYAQTHECRLHPKQLAFMHALIDGFPMLSPRKPPLIADPKTALRAWRYMLAPGAGDRHPAAATVLARWGHSDRIHSRLLRRLLARQS